MRVDVWPSQVTHLLEVPELGVAARLPGTVPSGYANALGCLRQLAVGSLPRETVSHPGAGWTWIQQSPESSGACPGIRALALGGRGRGGGRGPRVRVISSVPVRGR